MRHHMLFVVLCAGLVLAGCQKKQPQSGSDIGSVPLVTGKERSAHFAAVNRHLELGGTLYGYVDVDGDVLKLAEGLRTYADQIAQAQPVAGAMLKQDFAKIAGLLGLTDITAAGLSSVPDAAGGFRNRVYFHAPGGRHGLLAGLGGPAAPYVHTGLAPADADVYSESHVDLPAVYAAIKAVITQVAGESTANMVDNQLRKAGAEGGFSALELIEKFKGRTVFVLRADKEKTFAIPAQNPVVIPAFSLLLRIDGIGAALEKTIAQIPAFERVDEGALSVFTFKGDLPLDGLKPVLAIEGEALYLATSPAFFRECTARKNGLDQNPAYQKCLAQVGAEGNGIVYVSPQLFQRLRSLPSLNAGLPPDVLQVMHLVTAQIPDVQQPLITQRINLPDGILVRSHSYRSLKQDVAMAAFYNPVTVGLIAAMAIPAFQKIRLQSQEKTIQNNLRQISAAADQHMLETGKAFATYADISGPGRYITELKSVEGEDYRRIIVRATDKTVSVRTKSGKLISIPRE